MVKRTLLAIAVLLLLAVTACQPDILLRLVTTVYHDGSLDRRGKVGHPAETFLAGDRFDLAGLHVHHLDRDDGFFLDLADRAQDDLAYAHEPAHLDSALGRGAVGELKTLFAENRLHIFPVHHPEQAGVESLYFAKNSSSAIPVAQARGVVLLALSRNRVGASEYSPQAIKQAIVGNGRADKEQVQELIRLLLGMPDIPKSDHAADALAAAICHYNTFKTPLNKVDYV